MASEPGDELLDARAVARWLRLAVTTVYAQAAAGTLPHVRLWRGSRRAVIRFRRDEIEAFIKERSVHSTGKER